MLEVELEQLWRGALENSGTKVSIENTEYTCLSGMPAGSVNMQFSSSLKSPNSNIWEARTL